jgi:hypothetical protein
VNALVRDRLLRLTCADGAFGSTTMGSDEPWGLVCSGRGGQEDAHAPLRWASCPRARASMSGQLATWRAATHRPGATPAALSHHWGLESARVGPCLVVPLLHFFQHAVVALVHQDFELRACRACVSVHMRAIGLAP